MDSQKQEKVNEKESNSLNSAIGMVENWKRQALSEPVLNKILAKDYDEENFLAECLRERDLADVSELQSKMNHLRISVVNQLDLGLQKHYLTLIQDMQKIKDFSLEVEGCKDSIRETQKSLITLNSLFISRYQTVKNRIPQLKNARDAAFLITKAIKYLQNLKILQSLVSTKFEIIDLVKTSLILSDIQEQVPALTDLSFYEKSKGFLVQVRDEVVKKAEKKFSDALLQKNQVEITLSIQIFFHLGILADQLEQKANTSLKNSNGSWRQVLIKEYQGEYQGAIIVQIKNLLTEDYSNAQQMWLLNQCVKANSDPKSLESYETFLAGKNVLKLFDLFWNKQCQIISQSFLKLQEGSKKYNLNYKNIISSYPKIFGFLENFANNFNEYVLSFPDSLISYDFPELKKKFLDSLSPLSPIFYSSFTQKWEEISANILKNISNSDQPFQQLFQQLAREIDSGILQELQFQIKDNFSSSPHIFAQMVIIICKECCKLVQGIKNLYKQKALSVGESFSVIYILSVYKNQVIDSMLNCDNNEMINIEELDKALFSVVSYLNEVITQSFIPAFKSSIQSFTQSYQQLSKQTFNVKFFTQMQNFFKLYSPFGYAEKSRLFDRNFTEIFKKEFSDFMKEYSFLFISSYKNMSNSNEEQSCLGQEIESMQQLIEKSMPPQESANNMKLIINLQKIFYVDSLSAQQILDNSQDFSYYVAEGILQFAFALRMESITKEPLVSNEAKDSIQIFRQQVIANVRSLIQEYIEANKDALQNWEELPFLIKQL